MQSVVRAIGRRGGNSGRLRTIVAIEGILQAKGYAEIDAEVWLGFESSREGWDVEDVSLRLSENRRPVCRRGRLVSAEQGLRIRRCKPPAMHSAKGCCWVDRQRQADIRESQCDTSSVASRSMLGRPFGCSRPLSLFEQAARVRD